MDRRVGNAQTAAGGQGERLSKPSQVFANKMSDDDLALGRSDGRWLREDLH
eukprot:m.22274 g.22274  ORF g.22274 m.22274 type:complete len:51 (-) comp9280_c0_seq1:403-555(-)